MSLVTATAFQQSPAVQTRSFIALATLAVSQVDDDLIYQILVAFKSALARANESNTEPIISMLRCMCKIVPAVVGTSRYICVLFWLAVALLQGSHASYYAEASSLLQITLKTMEEQGLFRNNSVQNVLLEAREPLEEVTSQLDDMLRLSFERSFSFSLAAIIFKGLRHSALKESAEAALRTLLQVTVAAYSNAASSGPPNLPSYDTLGYFIALLPVSTTPKAVYQLLKESKFDSIDVAIPDPDDDDGRVPCLTAEFLGIHDSTTALFVTTFVGSILSTAQGDDAETELLCALLSDLCFSYPDIVSMTCVLNFFYASITWLICYISIDTRACKIESRIPLPTHQIHPLSDRARISCGYRCKIPLGSVVQAPMSRRLPLERWTKIQSVSRHIFKRSKNLRCKV